MAKVIQIHALPLAPFPLDWIVILIPKIIAIPKTSVNKRSVGYHPLPKEYCS